MFQKIFNPDNALMITMAQITDCIFLSLFFILGCIPVITAGASFAALYDAVYHGLRKGDKHCWQRFVRTFRQNLKGSILPAMVVLAVFALGTKGLIALWNSLAAGNLSWLLFSAGTFVAVLLLGILSVTFPLLSRFETGTAQLLRNTVLLGIANAPRALALGIVNALCIFLCVRYIFPLFFLPALAALIGTLFLEPMFKPYMPSEDAA